jgi:hypothetical protein
VTRLALALVLGMAALPAAVAHAQPVKLGPQEVAALTAGGEVPEVIVLTFGVGPRIFEKFGHAAICLRYPMSGREPLCFNYGVTDFNAAGKLVWGFLRGEQKFWLEPERWYAMISFYEVEDRDVFEQKLALTVEQARAFEHKLLGDLADDAHRFYIYDHFSDNCTTRLRDMIDAITGGKLRDGSDVDYPMTFRAMGRRGLAEQGTLLALTDFLIGRALDRDPTVWEAMFYPAVLREQIETKLGVKPTQIYKREGLPFAEQGSFAGRFGMLALAMIFTLPLALAAWRRRTHERLASMSISSERDDAGVAQPASNASGESRMNVNDGPADPRVIVSPRSPSGTIDARVSFARGVERIALAWAALYLGLWGLIIWALVAVSAIPGVRWNEAVLVFVPFDLALPFVGIALRRRYARGRVIALLLISALCAVGILHQPLWIPIMSAIVPLAIAAFT